MPLGREDPRGQRAESGQSRAALHHPMDCRPPSSPVYRTSQARTLEWLTTSFSGDLPNPRIEPEFLTSPALVGRLFTVEPHRKPSQRLLRPIYWAQLSSMKEVHPSEKERENKLPSI